MFATQEHCVGISFKFSESFKLVVLKKNSPVGIFKS
jgi:hypothetical protein